MPWGAVAGAAIGLVGDSMNKDKNGGAGTTSKEPWSEAQPWLIKQLEQGQALQDQYAAQPFNERQTAGYNNQYALSDYQRQLVPSLLEQLGASPVGFDPANPTNRPKAFSWATQPGGSGRPDLGQMGLLAAQPPAAAPAAAAGPASPFTNFDHSAFIQNIGRDGFDPTKQKAGLGAFTYGMQAPEPGTQAYRDLQEYIQWGGADPFGKYTGVPIARLQSDSQRN